MIRGAFCNSINYGPTVWSRERLHLWGDTRRRHDTAQRLAAHPAPKKRSLAPATSILRRNSNVLPVLPTPWGKAKMNKVARWTQPYMAADLRRNNVYGSARKYRRVFSLLLLNTWSYRTSRSMENSKYYAVNTGTFSGRKVKQKT